MNYPPKALVEFKSQADLDAMFCFAREYSLSDWHARLSNRPKWHPGMCARFENEKFMSFGNRRLYQDAYWTPYRESLPPGLHYCSAKDYIACVLQDVDNVEDVSMPDLDALL